MSSRPDGAVHGPQGRSTTEARACLIGQGGVALSMLTLTGNYYLLGEHSAHTVQTLPYLILLLCPLMHLFSHKHGGHDGDR